MTNLSPFHEAITFVGWFLIYEREKKSHDSKSCLSKSITGAHLCAENTGLSCQSKDDIFRRYFNIS